MEIIQFNVCHQEICTDREKLVSDTIGAYRCKFNFDSSWDGLNKVAVFVKGKNFVEYILDENNECPFADELIATTGTIVIGVYGTKDGVRYPTIKSKMLIVREGIVDGAEPTPPSIEIWEQLLNKIVEEKERAISKETALEEGLNAEISRAKARENEIENKIPSITHLATKAELEQETQERKTADDEFTEDLNDVHNLIDDLEDSKAEKDNTYTKAEVNQLVEQATPTDYDEVKAQVETNKNDIETINELIPAQASEENQLADKEFVNSSIATNTANFIGTFDSKEEIPTTGITQNDYAFVQVIDETTSLVIRYDRYKWNNEWLFEYSLNNSSFTAQQWETINSGLTSQDVEDLHNALATIEQIQTELVNKMERIVLYLSQVNNVWTLKNEDGESVSFQELYNHCRNKSHYVVVLVGNSKLRPQYVSISEIHCDGEDRDSQGSLFMRMIMTPSSLYYQTFRQAEVSDLVGKANINLDNLNDDGKQKIKDIIFEVKYRLVKEGLIDNNIVLTDEEKLKIETWLGLSENYLTYYNEMPYQVNGDYNPAHKKYVDEKLGNYYTKQETYSKEEVDNLIQPAIYGVSRALDTSSSGWARTGASIGKVANATKDGSLVANDFDVIYPWSDIKSCNMTADGVVTAWYGDVNFKFDGSNGDVMTYIPPFYYRRWQDGTNEHIQISKFSFDGASYSEGFYIGRYNTDNDYKSRANQFGRVNTNIGTFRTNSKAKGAKWQQLDWHYFLLEMLYLVEYADYNSQTKLGRGYADCGVNWTSPGDTITEVIAGNKFVCSSNRYKVGQYITIGTSYTGMQISDGVKITAKDGSTYTIEKSYNLAVGQNINSSRVLNGQCDGLGMRSGCYRNDGIGSVIYRGIENIFGNIYQFVDGLNIQNYIAYINYNPATYASDVFTGDYAQLGYTNASGTNAYIKKMGYDSNHPMVGLPIEIGGAESTYITDYHYQNSGNRIALVGGYFYDGGRDGLFYWYLNSASSASSWYCGARLLRTI